MKKFWPIILVFLFLTQCSSSLKKRSFGEVVDDNVIAMKLRTKLMKDKVVKASDVKIKVWKGTVKMSGEVETQDQINRAIELAEQQAGVKEVKAYLVLKDMPGVSLKNEKKPLQSLKKIFNKKDGQTTRTQNSSNTVIVSDLTDTSSQKPKDTKNKKDIKSDDDLDFQDVQH